MESFDYLYIVMIVAINISIEKKVENNSTKVFLYEIFCLSLQTNNIYE